MPSLDPPALKAPYMSARHDVPGFDERKQNKGARTGASSSPGSHRLPIPPSRAIQQRSFRAQTIGILSLSALIPDNVNDEVNDDVRDNEPLSTMPPDVASTLSSIIPAAKGLAALPDAAMGNGQ